MCIQPLQSHGVVHSLEAAEALRAQPVPEVRPAHSVYVGELKAAAVCALQMESVFRGLDQCSEEEKLQRLLTLKLRYFTPREVANLMGFPPSLCK